MGRALTDDLRWRIVYAIWWDGLDFADTARKFTSGPMVVSRQVVNAIWILFVETGDVASHQGRRSAPPANQIMDIHADFALIDILLDSPEAMLHEHWATFESETGLSIHMGAFCKAVRRLGFSRKHVRTPDELGFSCVPKRSADFLSARAHVSRMSAAAVRPRP